MKKNYLFLILISFFLLLITSCVTGNTLAKSKKVYQIGETGPGGGIVFYAENGTYMECSKAFGRRNWNSAQRTAKNYEGGGKRDWRLPTVDELELIYKNLKLQNLGQGFTVDKYWSSLQEDATYAWIFDFALETKNTYKKSFNCSIRAVRTFN